MKSGLPWNLKGVDDETRDAIVKAARLSGMSVGEWLGQVLDDQPEPEPAPAPKPARLDEASEAHDLGRAIERLTQRLGAMDETSRAAISGLADRLDEIEHHVVRISDTRHGSERARSLKGVNAMVQDLAREIDEADERARSMVEGLRAKAPSSVAPEFTKITDAIGELDQRIAAIRDRLTAAQPAEVAAPTDRLGDIRARLNTLLAQKDQPQPKTASPQAAAIEAALKSLEDRIENAKARAESQASAQLMKETAAAEHLARVEDRLAEIADRLATAEAERNKPKKKEVELAAAIREISSHQRAIDDRAETLAMRRDQTALSAAIAALRADLAALTDQVSVISRIGTEGHGAVFEIAQRIDSMAAEKPFDRDQLASIRADLETMRGMVEGSAKQNALIAIELRHDHIAAQLSDMLRIMPDRAKLEELGDQVADLRRSFEDDDSPRAIQRLEMHIAELGRSIEATLAAQQAPREPDPAVLRLEERLHDMTIRIEGLRDTGANIAAIHTVEQRLDGRLTELADRLGGMFDNATRPQAAAIEAAQRQLEGRLEDIVNRLGGMFDTAPQKAAIEHVHERLQAITERIDTLNASQREPSAALDAIKSEIGALRQEVADKQPAPPATDHLEAQIRDLAKQLETVATTTQADSPALTALEAQVAHLASELGAKPNAAALQQVEDTLARLQSHLADTAQESIAGARAEARKAVSELSDVVANNEIDSAIIRGLMRDLDSLRGSAGTDQETRSQLESVSETVSQVVERLSRLETAPAPTAPAAPPISIAAIVKPSEPAARLPVIAAARDIAPAVTADKKAADRRADFIAAARRAAQAVADEAAALDRTTAAAKPADVTPINRKPGAFARISQAIKSRKRPLLLAAAAIVLAIGAMQAYGSLTAVFSKSSLIADAGPAPTEKAKFSAIVPSASTAPTVPQVTEAALVPPAANPSADITFAKPESLQSSFTNATPMPEAASFAETAPPATDPTGQVILASATAGETSGLDARLGSEKLLTAAGDGDPAAAFEIATRYAEGTRVGKNLVKAAEWYSKAAEGGVAVAQYRLGSLYERGQGVEKNLTHAVDWYQRAADQGNVNAMHNLAVLLSEGVDDAPDHDKALQWFLAAGNYGVRDSQYNLGVIYARGLGIAQDLIESYKWFAIAAAQGDTDASARRDEVAKAISQDDLAKARAAVTAWHVKPPLVEANAVAAPGGGWDGPGETIGETDRQALVMKIQTLLAEAGYDPGPADGVAGPKTIDAVRAYQRKTGVPETGAIDTTLVASLGAN